MVLSKDMFVDIKLIWFVVHMQDIFKGGMEVFTLALRYNTPPPPQNREQMSNLRALLHVYIQSEELTQGARVF